MKSDFEDIAILRLPDVKRLTGLGKTTIYKLMGEDKFPSQVILTARSVGWLSRDVQEWIVTRNFVNS